jgi:hypothetical protein
MSRFARFMLIVVIFAAVFAVSAGMLVAYGLSHARLVRVEMHQRSGAGSFDLDLPFPAGLVGAAIDLAAVSAPHEGCRHLSPRTTHAWRPAARAACRALAGAPDGTLVQVESGPANVKVVKRGDTVEIQVHSPEGDVSVTAPAGLVWHLADLV